MEFSRWGKSAAKLRYIIARLAADPLDPASPADIQKFYERFEGKKVTPPKAPPKPTFRTPSPTPKPAEPVVSLPSKPMFDVEKVIINISRDTKPIERIEYKYDQDLSTVVKPDLKITLTVITKSGSKAISNDYSIELKTEELSFENVKNKFSRLEVLDELHKPMKLRTETGELDEEGDPIVRIESLPDGLRNSFWSRVLTPVRMTQIFREIEKLQESEALSRGEKDDISFEWEVVKGEEPKTAVFIFKIKGLLAKAVGKPKRTFEKTGNVVISLSDREIRELTFERLNALFGPVVTEAVDTGHKMRDFNFWIDLFKKTAFKQEANKIISQIRSTVERNVVRKQLSPEEIAEIHRQRGEKKPKPEEVKFTSPPRPLDPREGILEELRGKSRIIKAPTPEDI